MILGQHHWVTTELNAWNYDSERAGLRRLFPEDERWPVATVGDPDFGRQPLEFSVSRAWIDVGRIDSFTCLGGVKDELPESYARYREAHRELVEPIHEFIGDDMARLVGDHNIQVGKTEPVAGHFLYPSRSGEGYGNVLYVSKYVTRDGVHPWPDDIEMDILEMVKKGDERLWGNFAAFALAAMYTLPDRMEIAAAEQTGYATGLYDSSRRKISQADEAPKKEESVRTIDGRIVGDVNPGQYL